MLDEAGGWGSLGFGPVRVDRFGRFGSRGSAGSARFGSRGSLGSPGWRGSLGSGSHGSLGSCGSWCPAVPVRTVPVACAVPGGSFPGGSVQAVRFRFAAFLQKQSSGLTGNHG